MSHTVTEAALKELAAGLAKHTLGGDVFLLEGTLGAGKTTFARHFLGALGYPPASVTSPTYALVHEFDGDTPAVHADLYRLVGSEELDELGLFEARPRPVITLIEWGERLPLVRQAADVIVRFGFAPDLSERQDLRLVRCDGVSERGEKLLARARIGAER